MEELPAAMGGGAGGREGVGKRNCTCPSSQTHVGFVPMRDMETLRFPSTRSFDLTNVSVFPFESTPHKGVLAIVSLPFNQPKKGNSDDGAIVFLVQST